MMKCMKGECHKKGTMSKMESMHMQCDKCPENHTKKAEQLGIICRCNACECKNDVTVTNSYVCPECGYRQVDSGKCPMDGSILKESGKPVK